LISCDIRWGAGDADYASVFPELQNHLDHSNVLEKHSGGRAMEFRRLTAAFVVGVGLYGGLTIDAGAANSFQATTFRMPS
jgi:hypothetical protein